MERRVALFRKATLVVDRDYDDNKMFLKLDSIMKMQTTAFRKDIYLVLVYGFTEHPMMLAKNKAIRSKDDVIKVAKLYFFRWKIEKYF